MSAAEQSEKQEAERAHRIAVQIFASGCFFGPAFGALYVLARSGWKLAPEHAFPVELSALLLFAYILGLVPACISSFIAYLLN
ncbi:hypothetical protein WDZ92_24255, partial [Nostoc sp. NIES-2111]